MLLTILFWLGSIFPGYALARRLWPGAHEAGLLAVLAFSMLGTFLLLSPVSLACYAVGAPLGVFSAVMVVFAVSGLALCVRARADRELLACVRREPAAGWILLAGLVWLQARVGAYFDGDATFHVGRMRVLIEHGFTNRDIYLADYYFQHIYHSNLLYPIYASASLLTGQTYLEAWFYSQAWAKLMAAAGHYVLGYAVLRRPLAGWMLALVVITANAGETYTVYPNTIAVGWLLPLMLGAGYSLLAAPRWGKVVAVAAASFVMGQVHGLYAFYAGLVLAPALAVALVWPKLGRRRLFIVCALAGTLGAAPFLLVSQFGFRPAVSTSAAANGDGGTDAPAIVAPPPSGSPKKRPWPDVNKGKPAVPTPAVAAGGGHLEKSLELDLDTSYVWFDPRNMGGWPFLVLGYGGFLVAFFCSHERRAPLAAATLGAAVLSVTLFVPIVATHALDVLKAPFTIARMATVLSSLVLLGITAGFSELVGRVAGVPRLAKVRRLPEMLALIGAVAAATQLTGHAPLFFRELVNMALQPSQVRRATLERLEERRELLATLVPPGTTVLTTARFARSVVMICDCYVIIADRGHTHVAFAKERREELLKLNRANTPWDERVSLLERYGLKLLVFESRHFARLYRWTAKHGTVVGEAAGLRVVELRR